MDAWEALLLERKEDDGLPCYHLMEKYSTDVLGNTLLDVSIAVWECKRFYDYVRPISAIHFLYEDQPIQAWGGPFQGTKEIPGDQFQSYIPTPAFAEYVAGHSAFSSASAEILKSFTGSD